MSFFESPRFPERISYGAVGGPGFETQVVQTISGHEQRNGAWALPLHRWDVSQGVKSASDFATLRSFFLAAGGRRHAWRFKDWSDYSATHTDGKVTGLTVRTFQLVKRYTSGSQTLDRKIQKPIASGFELKNSGSTLTLTTDYTLDTATGIVTTVIDRTAANLTWLGEFDVPMRFDTDQLQARIEARTVARGLMHVWDSIPIVEVRV